MDGKPVILVVEDDEQYLKLVKHTLGESGYDVRTARTGLEALRHLIQRPPAVIVLDIGLPDISGLELCQDIRTSEQFRRIPIVFLTGHDSIEEATAARNAGGAFCASKVSGTAKIIEILDTICSVYKSSASEPHA